MQVAGQTQSVLGHAVQEAADRKLPLRTLAARLSVSVDAALVPHEQQSIESDTGLRWGTLALATALAVFGAAIAWAIYRMANA
jgi:hypothetical protein